MIILFDGTCGLCDRAVRFVLRHDCRTVFRFAPLQGDAAAQLLAAHGLNTADIQTVVLIDNGRAWLRSDAALRIARHLAWPWPLFYATILLPRPVRDAVYNFIARRRYRWFGRVEACAWVTPEQKSRFL